MNTPGSTSRTTVRRLPERSVADLAVAHAILDAAGGRVVAHVAVVEDGQPFVLPVAFARDGDSVIFHGSSGSRLFRTLAAGAPTCLTVTHVDGIVLARSAFESSMNYRCVMVLGTCEALEDEDKAAALQTITEALTPGRWEHLRPMKRKEMAATLVLRLPLDELSVKVRDGGPEDPEEDVSFPVWAGHVPFRIEAGEPQPAADLPADPATLSGGWA